MSCELCEHLKQENERLHEYIKILLTKVCTLKQDDTLNHLSVNLKRFDTTIYENMEKFEKEKLIELLEVKPPAYQSIIFIMEKALYNCHLFSQKVNTKQIKYMDKNNEIMMVSISHFHGLIMKEIYDYILPIVNEMSGKQKSIIEQNESDFDKLTKEFNLDNNRVENTLSIIDTKLHSKLHKDFFKLLR